MWAQRVNRARDPIPLVAQVRGAATAAPLKS